MTALPDDLAAEFPHLAAANYRLTSPEADDYNCLAWSLASDTARWWQPGNPDCYWPVPVATHAGGLMELVLSLAELGFAECEEGPPEAGWLRIVLYTDRQNYFTHVARQTPDGWWASKLGPFHDIEHDTPHALAGGRYGEVAGYMRRPVPPPT